MPPASRSPLASDAVAQREWPPLRAAIVDIAAAMDRLDLAGAQEARTEAQSLLAALLQAEAPERAELVLTRLSRGYDPAWPERFAAGETVADPPTDRG